MRTLFPILCSLLFASGVSAQAFDTFGAGSRSVGMAGAVSADVDDFSAAYYNPAGLARRRGTQIALGWFGAQPELNLNGLSSNVDLTSGMVLGLVVPGEIDDFGFAFAVGFHLPDQQLLRSLTVPRINPRWEFYDNRTQRTNISVALAIRPFDWLTAGFGISFLSTTDTNLSIRGTLDAFSPERGRLEHEVSGDIVSIRAPLAGIQVQPIEELSLGIAYRGEVSLDSVLIAQVIGDIEAAGFSIPAYFDLLTDSISAFIPQQLSFGASVQATPRLRINAEVTWVNWAAYVSAIGTASVVLDIDVPAELADQINIPDEIPAGQPIPAYFEDRFVPRIGVDARVYDGASYALDIQGGYFYEQSPAPTQSGYTNLVDTDRHTWSLATGLTFRDVRPFIPGVIVLRGHFQYSWLPERVVIKDSPVDPIGDYVASGHIFGGGLMLEVLFE